MTIPASEFRYVNGELYCEDVSITELTTRFGTPLYVYSRNHIEKQFMEYRTHLREDGLVCYSVKANTSRAILQILGGLGAGADVVSGGELYRAIHAGIDPSRIVFSGVGKTDEEIEYALRVGILMFNVESMEELENIARIAADLKKEAPVAIRVNPDVAIPSHPYISTGFKKAKFGLPEDEALEAYSFAAKTPGLDPVGIDCHIGSQILSLQPFEEAFNKLKEMVKHLKKDGLNIRYFDFGGGVGIKYRDSDSPFAIREYANLVNKIAEESGTIPILEPGRSIVGNAGAVIVKVLYVKKTRFKNFIITDIGMNDLPRPSLYDAYHEVVCVEAVEAIEDREMKEWDIVGPVCESGDFIARARLFPEVQRGAYIAVLSAGAYAASMASNYNSRPRAAEVLVDGDSYFLVKGRESIEYLIKDEVGLEVKQ